MVDAMTTGAAVFSEFATINTWTKSLLQIGFIVRIISSTDYFFLDQIITGNSLIGVSPQPISLIL